MLSKNFDAMANCLHEDVKLSSPLSQLAGKERVVSAAKNFGSMLQDIRIHSRFESGNQIMLAYDMLLPSPIGNLKAAVLMEFTDHLISKIELFFDATPFQEK